MGTRTGTARSSTRGLELRVITNSDDSRRVFACGSGGLAGWVGLWVSGRGGVGRAGMGTPADFILNTLIRLA